MDIRHSVSLLQERNGGTSAVGTIQRIVEFERDVSNVLITALRVKETFVS